VSRVHELSIAIDLVELACDEVDRRRLSDVIAVHVRIGSASGVAKDALAFSFDVVAAGTALEGAALRFEETPGRDLELRALEVADR
jgi:hydrogenase nickel incorporation protein HypA/HybF